jgi:serine/threonine protein kinase
VRASKVSPPQNPEHIAPAFARKIVRVGGRTQLQEVEDEARTAMKLSRSGCRNVVSVLQCGMMPNSPYFYIDMELCDFNLASYIGGFGSTSRSALGVWQIMMDICSGLIYIHDQEYVHRDLKPTNGISRLGHANFFQCSSVRQTVPGKSPILG